MISNAVIVNPYKPWMSGVTIGSTPVNISPSSIITMRDGGNVNNILVQNVGFVDAYLYHKQSDVVIEGIRVPFPSASGISQVSIPFNIYTTLWAATMSASTSLRLLVV